MLYECLMYEIQKHIIKERKQSMAAIRSTIIQQLQVTPNTTESMD